VIEVSNEDFLFEMANVRGAKVKVTDKLPFSFYFSGKNSSHDIRVKVLFDPEKIHIEDAGNLELHSNWDYVKGNEPRKISNKEIREMKNFFRKYLVIFCLAWDGMVNEEDCRDYFEGSISFKEFLGCLEFYKEYEDILNKISSIGELEKFCRKYNLVNFHNNKGE